jgi:hypothetical protein
MLINKIEDLYHGADRNKLTTIHLDQSRPERLIDQALDGLCANAIISDATQCPCKHWVKASDQRIIELE